MPVDKYPIGAGYERLSLLTGIKIGAIFCPSTKRVRAWVPLHPFTQHLPLTGGPFKENPSAGARPPLQSSRSRICNSFSLLQSHIHLQSSTPQAAINPSSHTYADGCPDSLDPSSPVMAPSVSPPSSPPTPNPQSTCSATPHPPGPLLTPRRRGLGCRGSRRPHQI